MYRIDEARLSCIFLCPNVVLIVNKDVALRHTLYNPIYFSFYYHFLPIVKRNNNGSKISSSTSPLSKEMTK